MNTRSATRESGIALIFALLGVIVSAAIASSLVMVTMTETRAANAASAHAMAFYLAESGLNSARWEIGESTDPGGDGEGTVSVTSAAGSYEIVATDLGSGFWRLDANGTSSGNAVVLEEVVQVVTSSTFPGGAITLVGDLDVAEVQFQPTTDLIIDGGNSPALAISDQTTYDEMGAYFATGVSAGFIAETDVVGSITSTFQPGDADLSIAKVPDAEVAVSITADMFNDLRTEIDTVWLPSAASQTIPGGSAAWGTSGSPVKYKFPVDQKITGGQTIQGYGTLLFKKNLIIESGGRLNWNGNVIIYGDDTADSLLEVDGVLNVTGNILVMGGKDRNLKVDLKSLGSVTVDGAFTVLTDYANPATQDQFLIAGDLTVDGLLTIVAPKHQDEFKPGSDVYVKGSLQLGRPSGAGETEFKVKFEDEAEFYKDDASIMKGANALVALDGDFGGDVLAGVLTTSDVDVCSWREIPSE